MPENSFSKSEFIEAAQKILSSKELNSALMESLPYPAMLIRKDRRIVTANHSAIEIGVEVGTFCWETFGKKASISDEDKAFYDKHHSIPAKGIKCTFCKADEALSLNSSINKKIHAGDIVYDTYWIPVSNDIYLHYAIILKN